jgi:hypothetical protein
MTENQFRRMALALDGAIEGAHMGHPDFRAHGRIFAALHHDRKSGMVALTPEQQQQFMAMSPAFAPESGAWGRGGCTRVDLARASAEPVGEALTLAWQNAANKKAKLRTRPAQPSRRGTADKKTGADGARKVKQ